MSGRGVGMDIVANRYQGVRAALLAAGGTEIELLEPLAPDTPIGRFLAKRGEGLGEGLGGNVLRVDVEPDPRRRRRFRRRRVAGHDDELAA